MAYTIVKSDGTVLTTIADGTINTTSTSLGLPGRNYAGYGQSLDTNFVHMLENFADGNVPSNPIRGQLWYDTNNSLLKVCPVDGATASNWLALTSTSSGGTTTFGQVTVTGNISANNMSVVNAITADTIQVRLATVTANATIANGNITTANIGTLNTTTITTGAQTTAGNITGSWTVNGAVSGNALVVTGGNLYITGSGLGIRTDGYYYANGVAFNPSGTYNNANVFDYLTGANAITQFSGNIAPTKITTATIAGGGNISGIWTLDSNARFQATYADLAERYESDATYEVGTVVELGGEKEVTAVKEDSSSEVFGVVSDSYAYLMNEGAGDSSTHPAIALIGRVKVKVTGKVRKGQRLVSAGNGIARGAKDGEATAFNVVGRSLVNKTTDDTATIEATVIIR